LRRDTSSFKSAFGEVIITGLVQDQAVQEFIYEGNGKYSFKIVAEMKSLDDPNLSNLTMSSGFNFTIKQSI